MKIASIISMSAAAALIAVAPASAEPMAFTIGGYFTQSVQLVDIDDHNNMTFEDEVLAQNAEIHFKGKTKLNNGTELGIRIELEASESDDQIDEHYLYLKGDWGKLILGAENGIGHLMQVRAPRFVPGLKMFDNSVTDDVYESAYDEHLDDNAIEDAHMSTKLEHISGDANKLSYMTPRVGGLQLGVSYAPNNADHGGGENNAGASTDAAQEDIIELGVSYKGMARGVGYKFSYTAVEGDTVRPGSPKPESISTGLALSYGDWVFGGNISEYKDLHEVDDTKYADSESIETTNYALKYKLSKTSYLVVGFTDGEERHVARDVTSASYFTDFGDDDQEGGTGNNADETGTLTTTLAAPISTYEELMVGGGTELAPGVRLGFYYTISEATHQIRGGSYSDAGSVGAGADGTAGTGGDDVLPTAPVFTADPDNDSDAEVSALGVTLHLRF
ncbi:MAG: Uncharacterised protein [Alphaproteobacteria bacterium]|nr:MAG: Uncharacterised protein [Alphaproteobacteria bacterium]